MDELLPIQEITKNNLKLVQMNMIPDYNIEDYDLDNDKDFEHYIKDIERVCRSSIEYRSLINYLRTMEMNKCAYMENFTNADTFSIKIEIHHYPLTLYEIVKTIINKRMYFNEDMEVEAVAMEVMYVHYFLMVGLVPLSKTLHKLAHSGSLYIDINKVLGDWKGFIEEYNGFVPDETKEKIMEIEKRSLTMNLNNYNLLAQNPILLQTPNNPLLSQGSLNLSQTNLLMDSMQDQINNIRSSRNINN